MSNKAGPYLGSLVRKELRFYLNSPMAYGVAAFYLAFTTLWFFLMSRFMVKDQASMRDYFTLVPLIFSFLLPAITMRSWSEERRAGTHELLMTMPYTHWQLVLAKYLAPMILVVGILGLSLFLPLSLLGLGDFDLGVLLAQYLGTLFLASTAVALGTWISSLTRNQVMAFLGSVSILLAMYLINWFTQSTALEGPLAGFLGWISINYHFDSFTKGLLDTRDMIFFGGTSWLFLFLNERRLVLGKWS